MSDNLKYGDRIALNAARAAADQNGVVTGDQIRNGAAPDICGLTCSGAIASLVDAGYLRRIEMGVYALV